MSDESKQIMDRILDGLRDAIAAIQREQQPEHALKRELELWLRERGFSRARAKAAVSRVFAD